MGRKGGGRVTEGEIQRGKVGKAERGMAGWMEGGRDKGEGQGESGGGKES